MDLNRIIKSLSFCQYPKYVYTSSGKRILVKCGSCPLCLTAKSAKYTQLCELEEYKSKYCVFVTLTYRDEDIPKCVFDTAYMHYNYFDGDDNFSSVVCPIRSLCSRDENYNEFIGEQWFDVDKPLSPQILDAYKRTCPRSKYNYHKFIGSCITTDDGVSCFGYLLRSDVTNFLKRVRSKCSYYHDEKIRFYLCAEYGPKTYRPHFHVLFYFNSPEVFANLYSYCVSSWKYGDCDYSLSRHKCGSYVSSYVNSAADLPSRYKGRTLLKTFSSHSNFLGSSFFCTLAPYLLDYTSKVYQSFTQRIFGKERVFPVTLSYYTAVLPRLPYSCSYTRREISELLNSVDYLFKKTSLTLSDLSEQILNACPRNIYYYHIQKIKAYLNIPDINYNTAYCIMYKTYKSRLYTLLLQCRKLFTSPLLSSCTSVSSKYSLYCDIISKLKLSSLRDFYDSVSMLSDTSLYDKVPFLYRQSLDVNSYTSSALIKNQISDKTLHFNDSKKHKVQNDLYNMLIAS